MSSEWNRMDIEKCMLIHKISTLSVKVIKFTATRFLFYIQPRNGNSRDCSVAKRMGGILTVKETTWLQEAE